MKKKLLIEGMSCGHCVMHVKNALMELEGVANVEVNLEDKSALVELSSAVEDSTLKEAVEDVGYDVLQID
jgi:copper ion binding protein